MSQISSQDAKDAISMKHTDKDKHIIAEKEEHYLKPCKIAKADHEVARVKVAGGVTRSLGDFEFIRVDVSIDLPCLYTQQQMDKAFEYGKNWVGNKVENILAESK